jgi:hypothetical protein
MPLREEDYYCLNCRHKPLEGVIEHGHGILLCPSCGAENKIMPWPIEYWGKDPKLVLTSGMSEEQLSRIHFCRLAGTPEEQP